MSEQEPKHPRVARFDAFLSHSSKDRGVAKLFQRSLERIGTPWYRLRTSLVFRDVSDLPAGAGLAPAIETAIASSSHFVLLASPHSATSEWVQKEVDSWTKTHSADSILLVVASGCVAWNEQKRSFDPNETNAISDVLAAAFTVEPLWVELPPPTSDLKALRRDAAYWEVVAKVAGRIRDVSPREIIAEERAEHRRRLRWAAYALVALAIAAAAAVIFGIRENDERRKAQKSEFAAKAELSRSLGLRGFQSLQRREWQSGFREIIRSLRENPHNTLSERRLQGALTTLNLPRRVADWRFDAPVLHAAMIGIGPEVACVTRDGFGHVRGKEGAKRSRVRVFQPLSGSGFIVLESACSDSDGTEFCVLQSRTAHFWRTSAAEARSITADDDEDELSLGRFLSARDVPDLKTLAAAVSRRGDFGRKINPSEFLPAMAMHDQLRRRHAHLAHASATAHLENGRLAFIADTQVVYVDARTLAWRATSANPASAPVHLSRAGGTYLTMEKRRIVRHAADGTPDSAATLSEEVPRDKQFSPDGRVMAISGHLGDQVTLFSTATGEVVRRIRLPRPATLSQAHFSSTLDHVFLSFDDGACLIAALSRQDELPTDVSVDGRFVRCAAFHPDGSLVAVGDSGGKVRILDVVTGARVLEDIEASDEIWSTAFLEGGSSLMVVAGTHVAVWDVRPSRKIWKSLVPGMARPPAVGFLAPDPGRRAAVFRSPFRQARPKPGSLWDMVFDALAAPSRGPCALATTPGHDVAIVGSRDGMIRAFSVDTALRTLWEIRESAGVNTLSLDVHGRTATVGLTDGTVVTIDVSGGAIIARVRAGSMPVLAAATVAASAHVFAVVGNRRAAMSVHSDRLPQVRSEERHFISAIDSTVAVADMCPPPGRRPAYEVVAVAKDGSGSVRLVSAADDVAAAGRSSNLPNWVMELTLSEDGRYLAARYLFGRAVVWDARTLTKLWEIDVGDDRLRSLKFEPGGQRLLLSKDSADVLIFDTSTGVFIGRLETGVGPITGLSFDAAGGKLTAGGKDRIWIWSWPEGTQLRTLEAAGNVADVRFSADGMQVVGIARSEDRAEAPYAFSKALEDGVDVVERLDAPGGVDLLAVGADNTVWITASTAGGAQAWLMRERPLDTAFLAAAEWSLARRRLPPLGAEFERFSDPIGLGGSSSASRLKSQRVDVFECVGARRPWSACPPVEVFEVSYGELEEFDRVLPNHPDLHVLKACAMLDGDRSAANRILAATRLGGANSDTLDVADAVVGLLDGRLEDVRKLTSRNRSRTPDNEGWRLIDAVLRALEGDREAARLSARDIGATSAQPFIILQAGGLSAVLGDVDAGCNALRRGVASDPDNSDVLLGAAWLALSINRLSEAVEWFTKASAAQLQGFSSSASLGLAIAAKRSGKSAQAIQLYTKAGIANEHPAFRWEALCGSLSATFEAELSSLHQAAMK